MTDQEFQIYWEEKIHQSYLRRIYQPATVNHSSPELYGLSDEWVKQRQRVYVKNQIKETRDQIFLTKRDNLNGGCDYQKLNDLNKKLDKLKLNLAYLEGRIKTKTYDIDALKKVPIDTITKVAANRFIIDNPFREEKSPSNSLYWYKDKNRWHDFGTGNNGDVIDLVMAINKCNFQQACEIVDNF
jgi:hypothetical protein